MFIYFSHVLADDYARASRVRAGVCIKRIVMYANNV